MNKKLTAVRFSIRIAGKAGDGISSSANILAKVFMRTGFKVLACSEFYSLIRGGHNYTTIEVSDAEIFAEKSKLSVLIAFDTDSIKRHYKDLSKEGVVVYDPTKVQVKDLEIDKNKLIALPWLEIVTKAGGKPVMSNMASLGSVLAMVGCPLDPLLGLIAEIFNKKGDEVIGLNKRIAQAGFDYKDKPKLIDIKEKPTSGEQVLVSGNEAVALGAISAGVKFFSGYPMTPATTVMKFLAEWAEEYDIVVKHAEDELAGAMMAIGAGFTGARSMTASSGGGLALMTEAFGLASMAEVPLVVVDSQRPGPATGLPTRTGQGDLRLMVSGTVDSAPRVVLAPGDVNEAFYLSKLAFNIAEIYQVPVFILVDKYLSLNQFSTDVFNSGLIKIDRGESQVKPTENYQRYALTDSGVSPRVLPGEAGSTYTSTGNEHDEYGRISEETVNRRVMMKKRLGKIAGLRINVGDIIKPVKVHGDAKAKTAVVFWGSPKGVVLEVAGALGLRVVQVLQLNPFPVEEFKQAVSGANKLILVENNFEAQLGGLIKEKTGIDFDNKILRYDGRPFEFKELKVACKT